MLRHGSVLVHLRKEARAQATRRVDVAPLLLTGARARAEVAPVPRQQRRRGLERSAAMPAHPGDARALGQNGTSALGSISSSWEGGGRRAAPFPPCRG